MTVPNYTSWAWEFPDREYVEECSWRGSLQADGTCSCSGFWLGAHCTVWLPDHIGKHYLTGIYIFWMVVFFLLLIASTAMIIRYWLPLMPLARVACISVGCASFFDMVRLSFLIWENAQPGKVCDILSPDYPYPCFLGDAWYALPLAILGGAFTLLQWSWVKVVAISKGKVCLARQGVRIVTGIMLAVAYAGFVVLLIPFDSFSPTLFLQGYYLIYALVLTVSYFWSGIPVWRLIRGSASGNALRFTFLLFCESATLLAYLLNSLLIVFGRFQHNPSLYFWGHAVMGSLYRVALCLWLLLAINPANFHEPATSTAVSFSHASAAPDDYISSSELFSSVSS